MLPYTFRRIFLFIPTLIAISLLTFFISINAPGDPVEIILNRVTGNEDQTAQKLAAEKAYAELRHKLGFDLPLFYFSLTDATVPDTLHKIPKTAHRETLKRLSNINGNWKNVAAYYMALKKLENALISMEKNSNSSADILQSRTLANALFLEYRKEKINLIISKLSASIPNDIKSSFGQVTFSFEKMAAENNPYRKYIPAIHWYGTKNQYHHWITNFLTGNFGISYQDKRPVKSVLYRALGTTLGISFLSILLAYLIAIPLGVHSAVQKGSKKEKTITTALFMLYSLPNFWIATMLVVFLCGGDFLSWFPAPGSPPIPDKAPFWYKFSEGAYRLALPLLCWTYGSLAFISRQMRGGIISSFSQDYIQTARAKGLDERQVIWKHAMKNSLLPVITLFASIFPLAISGSFVIETIFNIPGMGKLSLGALYSRDYPIIFTVMMFTAILTMFGNLVADILYALVDPRISYSQQRK